MTPQEQANAILSRKHQTVYGYDNAMKKVKWLLPTNSHGQIIAEGVTGFAPLQAILRTPMMEQAKGNVVLFINVTVFQAIIFMANMIVTNKSTTILVACVSSALMSAGTAIYFLRNKVSLLRAAATEDADWLASHAESNLQHLLSAKLLLPTSVYFDRISEINMALSALSRKLQDDTEKQAILDKTEQIYHSEYIARKRSSTIAVLSLTFSAVLASFTPSLFHPDAKGEAILAFRIVFFTLSASCLAFGLYKGVRKNPFKNIEFITNISTQETEPKAGPSSPPPALLENDPDRIERGVLPVLPSLAAREEAGPSRPPALIEDIKGKGPAIKYS